jgi:hypothetical protein
MTGEKLARQQLEGFFDRLCVPQSARKFDVSLDSDLSKLALDLEKTWFSSRHEFGKTGSSSVFRLLFNPGVEALEPGVDVRAGAHSDYGSITLLFQQRGQPGFGIQTQKG